MGDALVVPFLPVRERAGPGWCYVLRIEAPIALPADDVAAAQQVNDVFERQVRRYPEQYLWLNRRFVSRARPPPAAVATAGGARASVEGARRTARHGRAATPRPGEPRRRAVDIRRASANRPAYESGGETGTDAATESTRGGP